MVARVSKASASPVPEAIAAAADVPVGQRVEERPHRGARAEEVVGVHLRRDRGDEVVQLGQHVPVEHPGLIGADLRRVALGVGVEGEERPRVPQRAQHLVGGVADPLLVHDEVGAAQDGRRQQEPPHGVGAVGVEHLERVDVVAQALRRLLAVGAEHDAVGHARLEGGPVEQGGGQHVQRVEPAARLGDVLHDEVARVVVLEPVGVLERVVHLGEGHRARLEPAVEHLRHAPHRRLAGGVVGVGPHEVVDGGTVEIGDGHPEVTLELGQAAVDVDARVVRVVALPHRDGRAPEPVAADRPVAGVLQPLAEAAVADVLGHPADLLVELHHAVAELGHLDEPRRHGPVDERPRAAPAVRVRVVVGLVAHDVAGVLQGPDDVGVGVEDVDAGPWGDLGGEAPGRVHGAHDGDVVLGAGVLVVLAEAGREVDDAGALLGGDEVGGDHLEGVGLVGEEREQRDVAVPDEVAAGEGGDDGAVTELALVGAEPGLGQHVAMAVVGRHLDVVDVGTDGEGEVGRQRPRRGRPGQEATAVVELEPDGQRRVLAVPVHVVHAGLGVGQRRLAPPAVGQHAVALVDEALVPQRLERPHDALHVGEVERLVVVLEVDPARLAGDVALPLLRVLQHARAAGVVERRHAVLDDGGRPGQAELPLGLHLGRQPVAVPAEAPLDPPAAHRLVAGHGVLHVAGEDVAVVGQAVGERRAVVEHELVAAVLAGGARRDRGGEGAVALPELEDARFEGWEPQLRIDVGVAHGPLLARTASCGDET